MREGQAMVEVDVIASQLAALIEGEPLPSVRSGELGELLAAIGCVMGADDARRAHMLSSIGNHALALIVTKAKASMHAERELAQLRGRLN